MKYKTEAAGVSITCCFFSQHLYVVFFFFKFLSIRVTERPDIFHSFIYLSLATAVSWSGLWWIWVKQSARLENYLHPGSSLRSHSAYWHAFGQWEEAGKPSGNRHEHGENMQNCVQTLTWTQVRNHDPGAVPQHLYPLYHWADCSIS